MLSHNGLFLIILCLHSACVVLYSDDLTTVISTVLYLRIEPSRSVGNTHDSKVHTNNLMIFTFEH